MGKKKIIIILVLVLFIIVGWLLAFKSVTHMSEMKKQNELIESADRYMKKELYIRAIPLYEEAAGLKTTDKMASEIEKRLLTAYFSHGDMEKYAKIVEKKVDENTATEDEYLNVFDYYMNSFKTKEAFSVIKKGIDKTNSNELIKKYEQYRYLYDLHSTKYIYIEPTVNNTIMPVYDGEKWGYISSGGGTVISPRFDSVTPFSEDGIAAVSENGRFFTINKDDDMYGLDDNPETTRIQEVCNIFGNCIIAKKDNKYSIFDYDFRILSEQYKFDEITRGSHGVIVGKNGEEWLIVNLSNGNVVLRGIEDVAVNSYGSVFRDEKAMVKIGGKWHLIDIFGKDVIQQTFENAKAPESNGLIAVADSNDMWGFINNNGELVIDYQYYDAYSFSDEVAAVQIYNDSWIYISKYNVPISDEEFKEAKPFHNGVSQVVDYSDNSDLLTFKYYNE